MMFLKFFKEVDLMGCLEQTHFTDKETESQGKKGFSCSVPQLVLTLRPQPWMVYPLVRFIQEASWWMRGFKGVVLSNSSLIDCPALLLQGIFGLESPVCTFNWGTFSFLWNSGGS